MVASSLLCFPPQKHLTGCFAIAIGSGIAIAIGNRLFVSMAEIQKPIAMIDTDSDTDSDTDLYGCILIALLPTAKTSHRMLRYRYRNRYRNRNRKSAFCLDG